MTRGSSQRTADAAFEDELPALVAAKLAERRVASLPAEEMEKLKKDLDKKEQEAMAAQSAQRQAEGMRQELQDELKIIPR